MRKAFTLIELIFVIVIIGLLAAIAVPKFLNLKQHAEANSVVKTTVDAAQQAVEAAINMKDLEENNTFTLKDLINLRGKNWNWTDNNTVAYEVTDDQNSSLTKTIAQISLNLNSDPKKVEYKIDCTKFNDSTTRDKCKDLLGGDTSVDVNLTF